MCCLFEFVGKFLIAKIREGSEENAKIYLFIICLLNFHNRKSFAFSPLSSRIFAIKNFTSSLHPGRHTHAFDIRQRGFLDSEFKWGDVNLFPFFRMMAEMVGNQFR